MTLKFNDSEPEPGSIPINQNSLEFIKKNYPKISIEQWNDWKRQVQNTISTYDELVKIIDLSEKEKEIFTKCKIPFRITPYYLSLVNLTDFDDPIRKCVIPRIDETFFSKGEEDDPLHEDNMSPVDGLIHRYPDRVLFLVTNFCSTRCRYCTRSRMIENNEDYGFTLQKWQKCIDYIANHTEIRDVLISGGDPLTLDDDKIDRLLNKIKDIKHIEMVRIGTKVPTVLPQRITSNLLNILKKYQPLYISIHFTHPAELTEETSFACNSLANIGIPLGSQTVLMKGVNDEIEIMKKLMQGLLKIRVRPYYIYQCDPILGSEHFRTKVEKGLEIIRGIRGFTTGYAVPHYVIDAPGGGGKIPLLPEYYQGIDEEGNIILKNYEGNIYKYPNL